ncbi:GNAT family protein [Streptomyces sp. NPDC086182]|jgi:RimJ/RimL family protein N-acetyltransferase|uniref:GNAT family N-acetyltransferase n=1 Tax=Streptomyces sp. NPDC086182 TaxID=3155058 RepID=UPI00342618B2
MIEDAGIADDEHDAEPERHLAWRAASVGFAALDVDDAELLHGWRSDPVNAHEFGTWPRSLTATRERIERDSDDGDRDEFLVLLPDGTPIGYIALSDQSMSDGTAEVELMLDPRYRGHGHGTDALDALVDLAFGELPLYRLAAKTHTGNAPALAVLAKSGFVHEGVSRAACLHRGRRHDLAVFSLLRPEWEALNRPRAWDA